MDTDSFPEHLYPDLCDAHCHPHDDIPRLADISTLRTGHLTIMGVRLDDWDVVAKLSNPPTRLPCFGIHPWYVYRLMSEKGDAACHYQQVLQSPSEEEKTELIQSLSPPLPFSDWYNSLRQRLVDHPEALVGEVGIDRLSRLLPGGSIQWHGVKPTRVQCTVEHQITVLDAQLGLAAEFDRAVSIHCVKGTGHLFPLLKNQSPLRICLHSFGGSSETIAQFVHQLKHHTIYVSFSTAINGRLSADKLAQLISAVPDDRLLIESDLNSPDGLDLHMVQIAQIAANAKGWTIEHTVAQTRQNWEAFVGMAKKAQ